MRLGERFYVVSAQSSSDSVWNNGQRHDLLHKIADNGGVIVHDVLGVYNSEPMEDAVITTNLDFAKDIAYRFDQDSFLLVDCDKSAMLVYSDKVQHIGFWREVTKEYAEAKRAFTYDPADKKYYVAE